MSILRFKFDDNLDYQQQAIESVVGLFEGQPLANETYSISLLSHKLLNEVRIKNYCVLIC
ncbi:MAG: hypothetical protein GKR94_20960 [Gammaproteobacteria bacterium]|nr:hypothetical protein [Gammaproteobacteria bacterium]